MARFRIAQPAQSDLANILVTSATRWGTEGRRRYALLLAAAMRIVAPTPEGPLTQTRNELSPGLRSFLNGAPHFQPYWPEAEKDQAEERLGSYLRANATRIEELLPWPQNWQRFSIRSLMRFTGRQECFPTWFFCVKAQMTESSGL
jgi:plasmid stabilization system protein ParE